MKFMPLMLLSIIAMAGCHNQAKYMPVDIQGTHQFPKIMIGKWGTEGKVPWEITFAEDGSIISALVQPGTVEMMPGKTKTFDVKYGGKGIFQPGTWKVDVVDANQIVVTIELLSFYQDMGKDAIEGNSTDIFVGNISIDGQKWVADRFNSGKYIALFGKGPLGEGKVVKRVEFSNVSEPEYRETLIFKKIHDQVNSAH